MRGLWSFCSTPYSDKPLLEVKMPLARRTTMGHSSLTLENLAKDESWKIYMGLFSGSGKP